MPSPRKRGTRTSTRRSRDFPRRARIRNPDRDRAAGDEIGDRRRCSGRDRPAQAGRRALRRAGPPVSARAARSAPDQHPSDRGRARGARSESTTRVPELAPAFAASRAIVEARQGNDTASAWFAREALATGRAVDNPMIVGRVLARTALAAFYREDFDEAQDRALEAARWFERVESHRNAATAYSILYVIAHDWTGDPDVARFYARRMTMSAHLARGRIDGELRRSGPVRHRGRSGRRAPARVAARPAAREPAQRAVLSRALLLSRSPTCSRKAGRGGSTWRAPR